MSRYNKVLRGEEKRQRDLRIIEAYKEEGETMRSVGKRFRISHEAVRLILECYDVPRKPQHRLAAPYDVPALAARLKLFLDGNRTATVRECMEECGMTQGEVRIAAQTLGHRFKKREKVPHERVVEVVNAIGRKQAALALNLHPCTVDRHMQLEKITPYVPPHTHQ